jgi:hypothetical protein
MKKNVQKIKIAIVFFIILGTINGFAQNNVDANGYHLVDARANADSKTWKTYSAKTLDKLPGFVMAKEPSLDIYGGWQINQSKATGFF